MALLALDGVWKRFERDRHGVRQQLVLRDVTFELDPGELVAVVGRRRSGRTTLLHVAAGLERPTAGAVRFDGADLDVRPMLGRPGGIGWCSTQFSSVIGDAVVEHVAAPLLGDAWSTTAAQRRAYELLRRVGAAECEQMTPSELAPDETIRVAIARALTTEPRLLLVDDPALGVQLAERDRVLGLLREIADDGAAVLMTVDSATELAGADRALSLDTGELRGQKLPAHAPVVPLRRARSDAPT